MPTATPAMAASASGVSSTRSSPKRACNPTVARNTPPFTPTSSPSTRTLGSCANSYASARFTASTRLTSAMRLSNTWREATRFGKLLLERRRHSNVKAIEHRLDPGRRDGEVLVDRLVHLIHTIVLSRIFLVLVPSSDSLMVVPQ